MYFEPLKDFHGQNFGIRILVDPLNKNIMFTIIIYDVDDWFVYNETIDYSSSYWIDDLINISKEAKIWMEENCEKCNSGYGWKLKDNYKEE